MKFLLLSFVLLFAFVATAQVPSYYNGITTSATGSSLKSALASRISSSNNIPSYTPGVWNALKVADLVTPSSSDVLLIYGYNDNDGDSSTDRTRNKNRNGGGSTDWNREHVYPKSLGTPNLGTSGPGADLHHLRAADVSRNGSRSSKKFAAGSGNSGNSNSGWYPGDEFKGDVARMMMYMYVRYQSRCLPTNVGIGSVATDNMLNLFLQWNVDDPVSAFEVRRNDEIENVQGNRNPFIDNPAFATQIWGGPQAEDRFNGGSTGGGGGTPAACATTISSFPYTESFENSLGAWTQGSGDDFDWARLSGGTPSSNTGPTAANNGSFYVYMEASNPNNPSKRAILNSPCFDLSGKTGAQLTFDYHMYGTAVGGLNLEVSTDGSNWTSVWSKSGNQGNSWQAVTVDLSAYNGEGSLRLRFNGLTGSGWSGDMAVDNLNLTTGGGSTGGGSTTDVTLRITFDNYPGETSWEIRDGSNQVVHSGGNYGNQSPGSIINVTKTLNDGCYTFIFKDSYGDGICCSQGNGSYVFTNEATNNTITSGSSFTSQRTKSFCVSNSRFAPSTTTTIEEVESEEQGALNVTLYPNPVQGQLNLKLEHPRALDYMITNQVGQVLATGRVQNQQIEVANLPKGMYILLLNAGEERVTKTFVKQ